MSCLNVCSIHSTVHKLYVCQCACMMSVCHIFYLPLCWWLRLFQKVSGLFFISQRGVTEGGEDVPLLKRGGSLSGSRISPRLPHCCAVNQPPVSLLHNSKVCCLPHTQSHPPLHSYEDTQRLDVCLWWERPMLLWMELTPPWMGHGYVVVCLLLGDF